MNIQIPSQINVNQQGYINAMITMNLLRRKKQVRGNEDLEK
jgi:hypothetical protein